MVTSKNLSAMAAMAMISHYLPAGTWLQALDDSGDNFSW